jgi:rhamnosyltransferase
MTEYKATVFIPTWFGEQYLDEVLRNTFNQKVDFPFEVLIYDTSSQDRTMSIIKKHAKLHDNLRYKVITKEEFGHGRTRQAAAHDARGEIIVYLTQDATPADKHWLHEMVMPFTLNEKVMAVLGKQDPRAHAFPLLKYEIRKVFSNFGSNAGTTLFYDDYFMKDPVMLDAAAFYSDVNSATRRQFLLDTIPYRDVPYAEDQLFGRDVMTSGYMKAYTPRGRVLHSNDITLREYKHRMFDETLGLRRVGFDLKPPSIKSIVKSMTFGIPKDTIRILRDPEYSLKRKVYWVVVNPLYHVEKWRGVRLGAQAVIGDEDASSRHSLEQKRHTQKRPSDS